MFDIQHDKLTEQLFQIFERKWGSTSPVVVFITSAIRGTGAISV